MGIGTKAIQSVFLLVLVGCAHQEAGSYRTGALARPEVLAQVGESTLSEAQLPEATRQRLVQLDDAYLQERFSTVWAGLEDAIGTQLLTAAAQSEHKTLAAYLASEVDAKVGAPSDEEVRGLYEANRAIIDVPFEEARIELVRQYVTMQRAALRRGLIDQLRREHPVQLSLAAPALSRRQVDATGPSIGAADAPIVLVVFSDFACPYSAQARRLTKRLIELYGNKIRIVHRNYPLGRHKEARGAALYAACAAEQERFWPLAELFYENQTALSEGALRRYALLSDVNNAKLTSCLASGRAAKIVDADIALAQALGASGTPAMYLNGMQLRGVLPLPVMCAFIEQELRRLGMGVAGAQPGGPRSPEAGAAGPDPMPVPVPVPTTAPLALEPPHG